MFLIDNWNCNFCKKNYYIGSRFLILGKGKSKICNYDSIFNIDLNVEFSCF